MKTVRIDQTSISVEDLIALARVEPILLVSGDGTKYVLEEADDFDREAAALGSNEEFLRFLEARRKEPGRISIEEFSKRSEQQD